MCQLSHLKRDMTCMKRLSSRPDLTPSKMPLTLSYCALTVKLRVQLYLSHQINQVHKHSGHRARLIKGCSHGTLMFKIMSSWDT